MRPFVFLAIATATIVIATHHGNTGEAAWPGDNGRILYVDRVAGGIWSMEPESRTITHQVGHPTARRSYLHGASS
jgi:hypothetical protein